MRDHRPFQAAGPLTCQVAARRARGVLRSNDGMTPHFQMGSRRRTRATAPFQSCQSLSLYCSSSAAPPKTDPRSPGAACTVSGSGSRTALGIARCGLVQSRALVSTHPTVTDLQYRYPQTQGNVRKFYSIGAHDEGSRTQPAIDSLPSRWAANAAKHF